MSGCINSAVTTNKDRANADKLLAKKSIKDNKKVETLPIHPPHQPRKYVHIPFRGDNETVEGTVQRLFNDR